MATTSKTEKIFVGDENGNPIELTGVELKAFLDDRKTADEATQLLETEYKAKQKAREDAIKKLAEIAGLTAEELTSIL